MSIISTWSTSQNYFLTIYIFFSRTESENKFHPFFVNTNHCTNSDVKAAFILHVLVVWIFWLIITTLLHHSYFPPRPCFFNTTLCLMLFYHTPLLVAHCFASSSHTCRKSCFRWGIPLRRGGGHLLPFLMSYYLCSYLP